MNKTPTRQRLLVSSILSGMTLAALSVSQAAAQAPAPAAEGEVSEVVVTGTRIPQPNLTSVSPVQVVNSQEIRLGGRTETADIINQLPQVQQNSQTGLGSTSNPLSGPGGVATIDLRGLGQTRTLVLVDGRRLGIGDPNTGNPNPSPDINQIPSQLIDRIEVLTGGASATYGSDAIAGVVNFIMKRDFEGLQIDGQAGVFQHGQHSQTVKRLLGPAGVAVPGSTWDGQSRDLAVTFGTNAADGRGNLTAYVTYHDQNPVTQGKRDFSSCQVNVDAAGIAACAGTTNSNIFFLSSGLGDQFAVVGNTFQIFNENAVTTPPPLFNSNPFNFLIQADTRWTAGFFAKYDINKGVNIYSDFQFMNDRANVQIAPTGLFQGSGASADGGFLINFNNPFLSAQQQGAICTPDQIANNGSADLFIGRRNIEGGPRNSFFEHQNYRVVLGSRGEITGSWKYDLYGSYYYTTLFQQSQNYLSISKLQQALQVITPPGGGAPVCISGGSCVPYNIFQDGGVTPEALQFLTIDGSSRGSVSQRIVEGNITGDLGDYGVKSPWAADGVGVNVGFQQRREHLEFSPDQAQLDNDLSGAGGASTPIDASIRVTEGYAEARVPIITDMDYAKDLHLELGYRFSDYSIGIEAHTYKVGGEWAPVDDIRFRATYQRAIRAPNILELFTPQSVTNTSQVSEDPCAADATSPATPAQCANTGILPGQFGVTPQCPAGQCAVLTGGNANLEAEKAKTYAIGFTFTPTFWPTYLSGFNASVDYYHIKIKGTIGAIPLGVTLQNCLNTGDPEFCSRIHRASNGTLFGTSLTSGGFIDGTNVNVGSNKFSGLDVQANYSLPMEAMGVDNWGGIQFNLTGTYLINAATIPLPGELEYDCVGLFGPQCQTVNPRWRHTLRVNWVSPWNATFSMAWRYFGGVKLETDTNEPTIGLGTVDPFNHTLPGRSYLDLAALWNVNEQVQLRVGINNVLDQDPPLVNALIAGTGLPNTYPSYDLLGRKMFVAFTTRF